MEALAECPLRIHHSPMFYGIAIKYIQKQLGHSKPTVTLEIYAHLFDDNNPEAAKRLDDKIFQEGYRMVAEG